eukprot:GHVQ01032746.1.p1 GENE.GHVQ01032746.1~~GHVQ01032746.1.p1  ORF type:complete len:279 (+),score=43.11 GHVQ01032746.1:165-1001(+)
MPPKQQSQLLEQVSIILASGSTRYDPANLSVLTDYVDAQMTGQPYHLDSNLAVLTHYTLYPQCFDVYVGRKILIKALMQLPNRDFSDCLCLIPERLQKDPKLQGVIRLEDAIQSCRFKQVWDELKDTSPPSSTSSVTGGMGVSDLMNMAEFIESLRQFICEVATLTYHTISAADLASLLNLPVTSTDFERAVRYHGWVLQETPGGPEVRINNSLITSKDETLSGLAVLPSTGGGIGGPSGGGLGKGGKGYHGQATVHRAVDKHMSPENLRMCFAALSR